MYVALLYDSRLYKNSALSICFSGQTNKPFPCLEWRTHTCVYPSIMHNVYQVITCCLQVQILIFSPFQLVFEIIIILFYLGTLQLWMTFYHPQLPAFSLCVRRCIPGQYTASLCIYVAFYWWKSEQKSDFVSLYLPQFRRYTENVLGLCIIYCFCYLYTAGFEINNLAISYSYQHFSLADFKEPTNTVVLNTCSRKITSVPVRVIKSPSGRTWRKDVTELRTYANHHVGVHTTVKASMA